MKQSDKSAVVTSSEEEVSPLFETAEKVVLPGEPYRGIRPFRYADRYVFAAREWEKEQLINLVTQYRGTLVYGQSGIGKSSIINAALIPGLLNHRFQPEVLRVSPNRDGTFIVYRILQSDVPGEKTFLSSLFADAGSDKTEISLSFDEFRKIISLQTYPKPRKGEKDTEKESNLPIPVLIFDQFEELITLFEETGRQSIPENEIPYEGRRAFQLKLLSFFKECYYDPYLRVKFIFVFREDYLAKFSRLLRAIPDLRDHSLRIKAIDKEDIFDIIKCPFLKEESKAVYRNSFIKDDNDEFILLLDEKLKEYFHEREAVLTEIQIVCQYLYEELPEKRMAHFRDEKGEVAEPIRTIIQLFYEKLLNSLNEGDKPLAIDILSLLVLNEHTRNIFHREAIAEELKNDYPVDAIFSVLAKLDDDTKLIKSEIRSGGIYYEINSESLIPYINKKKIEKATVIHETRKIKEDLERQRVALMVENYNILSAAKTETDKANKALQVAIAGKKRTNRQLKILIACVAGLAALALIFMEKSRLNTQTIANNLVVLNSKTDLILSRNKLILKNNDSIVHLNDSLKLHENRINSLNDQLSKSLAQNKDLLAKKDIINDSLKFKNLEINTLNNSLQGTVSKLSNQSNSLQTQVTMNALKLQPFYKFLNYGSDTADIQLAANAVNTLTQMKLGPHYSGKSTQNDSGVSPLPYSLLLNDLNQATQIKYSARSDNNPMRAILQIRSNYLADHSKLVGQIGLGLVNNQWINIQNTILPQSNYSNNNFISAQLRAVAKDHSHFAFSEAGEIVIADYDGKYIDGYTSVPVTDLIPDNADYFTNSPPKAIGFNDRGNLMILKQSTVFEYDVKERRILPAKFSVDKTINIASFSPDGHKLISDSYTINKLGRHISIQVYDIDDRSKRSISIKSNSIDRISVSKDNQHAIVEDNANGSWNVDLSNQASTAAKIGGARRFLGVTPDGDHILAALDTNGTSTIHLLRFNLQEAGSIQINNMIVSEAMISEDGKGLLVSGMRYSFQPAAFYIKRPDEAAAIFNFSNGCDMDSCVLRYAISQQAYLNIFSDNTLISLENLGNYRSLKVLKYFAPYADFESAYSAVAASLPPSEKVKNGTLSPEVLYSEDEGILYSTAKEMQILNGRSAIESSGKRLAIASKLYDKLLERNNANLNYLADYRTLITTRFSIDASYQELTDGYKKIIQAEESVLKRSVINKYSPLPQALARDYGNLAWYLLFIKGQDYNQAIKAALRGLEIDSATDFTITNLALGYLLNSDFGDARNVYEKYKDRRCRSCADPSPFSVAFLSDLNELKGHGLFPDGSELDARRQKLIKFLEGDGTVLDW